MDNLELIWAEMTTPGLIDECVAAQRQERYCVLYDRPACRQHCERLQAFLQEHGRVDLWQRAARELAEDERRDNRVHYRRWRARRR